MSRLFMMFGKPTHELSIGEILSLTFDLYRFRFLQFFLPFLISGVIIGVSTSAIQSHFTLPSPPHTYASEEELFSWLFDFISTLITMSTLIGLVSLIVRTPATAIAIKYASDRIATGSSNLGGSFKFVMSKLPFLLIAQIVVTILTVIGFILLVVPGIIIAIIFSLVLPVIVVEQKGAFESLGRSKKLVDKRWLKTFGLMLALGIITGIVVGVAGVVAMLFSDVLVGSIVRSVISAFVSPLSPVATTYLYYSMVSREIPPPSPPPPPTF